MIMRLSCVMPYLATGCGFRRSQSLKTTVFPRRYKLYLGANSGMRYSTPATAFYAAAFAALSGTLKAGSWLVLLLPVWEEWKTNLMPTRCAGVIALTLLRRRILSSISNVYLRRITTPSSGGKTSRSRWCILLPGTHCAPRDRHTTTRTTATLTAVTDHAAGRGSGNGCAWAR